MMKGEYGEEEQEDDEISQHQNHHNNPITSSSSTAITISTPQNANDTNIFSKFQHHPKFLSPPPHFLHPPHLYAAHHHHQQHQQQLLQHSEDAEITPIRSTPPPSKKPKNTPTATPTTTTSSEDGGTVEVSRRPRGRPPGSKNKSKPPIIITRDTEPAMSPYILEIPSGSDLVESLTRFTRRRGVGLCVLTATGAVANVVLKQPSTTAPGGTVTFRGSYDILSLSATLLTNAAPFSNCSGGFTISLAGPQGQICGGKVVGSLVCAGTVYVVAASFNSPSYCRLPLEVEDDNNHNHHQQHHNYQEEATGGDGGGQSGSPVSGDGSGGGGGGGTQMSLYNSSEVLWAPTPVAARPQPPPY